MPSADILKEIAEALARLEKAQAQARNARLVNDRGHVYYVDDRARNAQAPVAAA